jgi:LemA protein
LEVLSQTAKQRNSLSMDLWLLDNIIEDLTIIAESYPELKEDSEFGILISELENSESRVVPSIINYNNSATSYNTSLVSIPDRFYASLFGFDSKELIILLSVK